MQRTERDFVPVTSTPSSSSGMATQRTAESCMLRYTRDRFLHKTQLSEHKHAIAKSRKQTIQMETRMLSLWQDGDKNTTGYGSGLRSKIPRQQTAHATLWRQAAQDTKRNRR